MSAHAPARSKTKDLVLRAAVCAVLLALLAAAGIWLNRPVPGQVPTSASQQVFVLGKVTAVLADDAVPDTTRAEGRRVGTQTLEVQILSGSHKGEIMQLDNHLSALFNVDVQPGSRVVLRLLTGEDGSYYASMFNYDRGIVMAGLALVFVGLLAALGGKKGLRALAGLVFTLVCVWWLLIPGLIRGLPAIPLTIFTTVVTAAAALLLLNGFSRKTACAVLGCAGGVVAAGLAAALAGWLTPMNGFNMPEAENLILYGADQGLKISGLLVCGVLIASLGAVMDVAMGIASAMWELRTQNPALPARALLRSGMQVGRDAMGTMANTLILAFAGSSLNMLVLVQVYDIPLLQLVNTDYLCIEIIQSLAGSIGILLTVPLVAAVGARLMAAGKSA